MKFPLGQVVATIGVTEFMKENNLDNTAIANILGRHVSGDWGDIDEEDKGLNDQGLIQGTRLLSVYKLGGETVWIITEWDRSVTTILFPSEY